MLQRITPSLPIILRRARKNRILLTPSTRDRWDSPVPIRSAPAQLLFFLRSYFSLLLISAHYFGCFFFWLAMRTFFSWPSWTNTRLFNCTPINELTDFDKWMASFHFALSTMTTVGYGDILPANKAEFVYTILLQLVGIPACKIGYLWRFTIG